MMLIKKFTSVHLILKLTLKILTKFMIKKGLLGLTSNRIRYLLVHSIQTQKVFEGQVLCTTKTKREESSRITKEQGKLKTTSMRPKIEINATSEECWRRNSPFFPPPSDRKIRNSRVCSDNFFLRSSAWQSDQRLSICCYAYYYSNSSARRGALSANLHSVNV